MKTLIHSFTKSENKKLFKLIGLIFFLFFSFGNTNFSFGQTTYDWLNTAPDGNFRQGASGARWNPGGLWDEPPYGIVQFNNNNQTTMTNNVAGTWSQHKINFGSSATTGRTIGGNTIQFFDFGGTWPFIRNQSTATHTINFPVLVGWTNMEFITSNGNLNFGGTVGNQGNNIYIYGNNAAVDGVNRAVRFGGVVSGSGFVNVSQFGVVKLNATHTYTGQTQIDNGELWIETSGSIAAGSGIFVGNGGQMANITKFWISHATGGTTASNNITVNNGNASTRFLGGFNTSGTHTFSGNITNNASGGLRLSALLAGGTTTFSGVISGANPIVTEGLGTIILSGANTYSGATTISQGVTRLEHVDGLGTTAGATTVTSGAVLELNAGANYPAEPLTLNGTGISNGGALRKIDTGNRDFIGNITLGSDARINVTGGTLIFRNATFNFASNTLYLGGNLNFEFGPSTVFSNAGKTTGDGAIYKDGSGTFNIRPATTLTGDIYLVSGETRQFSNGPYSGSGLIIFQGGSYRSNDGTARPVAKPTRLDADLTIGHSGGGAITFSGAMNLNGATRTLTMLNSNIISGIVSNGGLTKAGTGNLTLSGANTYAGDTRIAAGDLTLDHQNALQNSLLDMATGDAGNLLFGTPANYTFGGLTGTRNINTDGKILSIGNNNNNTTYSGVLSGAGGITKIGTGIFTLSNLAHTFTGATTITNGELRINPSNTTASYASQMVLNGGTLASTSIAANTVFTSSSTLNLNANSEIDLGANVHELRFANSSAVTWAGSTLVINGWTGLSGNSGTAGKIFFGNDNTGLTVGQLAKISFTGYPGVPVLLSTGELVPPFAAVTYEWNATTGSADWQTPASWTPARNTPLSSDILTFPNGGTSTATNVPTEAISQFIMSNSTAVTLLPSAGGNTLSILGETGVDLDIPSGCSLTIGGSDNLIIEHLTSGNTASIAGTLIISNANTSNTYSATNSTTTVTGTLRNGGVVTSTSAQLVFNSGGLYEHNHTTTAGAIATATWNTGSTCAVIGYTTNTTSPTGWGQSFHHFTWNTPNQNTGSVNASGNLTTVNGNLTVIATGTTTARELRLTTGSDYSLTIGGNLVVSGGTFVLSNGSGTPTISIGGNLDVSGGSLLAVTGAGNPNISVTGNFNFSSGTINLSTSTGNSIVNINGNFSHTGGTITETGGGNNSILVFNGSSAQTLDFSGTIANNIMYRFDNSSGFTLTGDVSVNNNSYVSMRRGAFSSTGIFTYATTGTLLIYDGSTAITFSNYEFPATNGPVNLTINNTGHVTLHATRELPNNGVLTLTNGRFRIGSNNFSLLWSNVGAIAGTFDVNTMVVADGSGQLIRRISTGTNSYTWPVGDETGIAEYSPVTLNFTANGNASRLIGFNVVDANHPQLNNPDTQTHYLSRYWRATNSEASTYTYTAEFGYPSADINNTEAEIKLNIYNGSAWQQAISTAASNVLSADGSETHLTFPIGSSVDFTGRVKQPSVYAWIPTTTGPHDFQSASNWNPNRTTLLIDDILTFPNGSASISNNVPTQSIGQLLMSNSTTVTFIPETGANRTLTLTGAAGTDFNIPAGSAMIIGDNAGSESLTISYSGSGHVAAVVGTLTTSLNASIDHRYNGTNATTTVSGTVNNGGIVTGTSAILSFTSTGVYNHIRNGGAVALATWDVVSNCNITGVTNSIPTGSTFNQTFGNFTWNCTSQSAYLNFGGNLQNINGNLSFLSTNGDTLRFGTSSNSCLVDGDFILNLSGGVGIVEGVVGASTHTLTVNGDINILSGLYRTGGPTTTNNSTVNANGDLNINGGDFQFTTWSTRTLNLRGDLNLLSGNFGGTANVFFIKQGTSPIDPGIQNINRTSGTISGTKTYNVGVGASFTLVNLLTNFDMNGSMTVVSGSAIDFGTRVLTGTAFTLNNGGNLITANTGGIASSGATGSVQTTTRTFNASCNFIYNATSAQITGTGLPATSSFLTIANPTYLELTNNHSLNSGGSLNLLLGQLRLGNSNFTVPEASTIDPVAIPYGPFSASKMIVTNGTGELRKSINSTATFTWPIGEITGTTEYTPATLTITTSVTGTYGMRVENAAHPDMLPSPVYLNRFWRVSSTSSSYSWTGNFSYMNADVVGTPLSNIRLNIWNPNAPSSGWQVYNSSSASANILSVTSGPGNGTMNNTDITGREHVPFYYRTVNSGNWTNTAIWEVSTDPTFVSPAPVAATYAPNDLNSDGILIRTGHTVAVNGSISANDIEIQSTAIVNINSGNSLTVPNGTAATDVLNNGRININTGATMTIASGAQKISGGYVFRAGTFGTTGSTLIFNNGSTFQHASDGGSLPTATWDAGSTCLVSGITSVPIVGASLGQAFHHFTWTCNQSTAIGLGAFLSAGNGASIGGNFTVTNTGGLELRLAATQNYTLNIAQDLIVSGGILVLVGTSTGGGFATPDATVNVGQDVLISGTGGLMVTNGWAALNGTNNPHLNITRDLLITATSGVNLIIAGADPSVSGPPITFSPSQITVGRHYSQTAASTVQMSRGNGAGIGTMRVAGNFTHSNGTISVLVAADGEIIFNGTTVQTYTSGGTVTGDINYTLNTNAILDMNTSFTSGAGTFTMQANSEIRLGSADGISTTAGIGNTRNTGTKTFPAQGTYVYNGVVNQVTGNLLPTNITGSLNINNSGGAGNNVVTLTTNNTSVNTLNLQAGFFAAGTGQNLTINSGGTVNASGGDIAVGAQGGTLTFVGGSGGTFTGNANPYNVYSTSGVNFGTGTVTIQDGGTFRINAGGFVQTNAPFYASGATLQYNTGGTFGRNLEWRAASGRGFPHHVLVSNNTTINPGANSNTGQVLNTGGNVTIESGSNIYMDFDGNNMTVPLIIGGNLTLIGNLSGSGAAGGDVRIRGNWINNGTGANYFPNGRAVFFDGTSSQDIGGSNTTVNPFAFVLISNAAGVTLSSNQQINNNIEFTNGRVTLNNNNLRMNGTSTITGANASRYFITNGTGLLYRTFANVNTTFPVGFDDSSYNPLTLNQAGTPDFIGVRVVETPAYSNAVNDEDEMVLIEYFLSEDNAGGNSLFTGIQWNASNEGINFVRTDNVYHGNWTGSNWGIRSTNATTGSNPYVSNSIANLSGTLSNTPLIIGNVNGILSCIGTIATGNWNVGGTWQTGVVPDAASGVCINHAVNLVSNEETANVTLNSSGSLNINVANSLTIGALGGITNSSGSAVNLGDGTVIMNGVGFVAGAHAATIENLTLNGNTTLTAATTVDGNLTLNSGSFVVTGNPIYTANSTLVYNNTGSYNVNNEWTGNSSTPGSGIPQNVTIQNGTTVNMPNANRGLAGNLNITNGGLTLNATSGDLYIAGNWTRNNTSTTFTPNNRAVFFNGAANQTITITSGGTESFAYLINSKPSNNLILNSSPATNVNVTASTGNVLGLITTSSLDLNGQTMNLTGTSGNIELVGGAVNIIGGLNSVLAINNGAKTVTTSTSGTLITGGDVTIALSNGINFGSNLTTIQGRLQIAAGGFVTGNAPNYASGSTLRYFTGNAFNRGIEWSTLSGAGYPHHVVIDFNGTATTLNLLGGGSALRRIAGNLTINNGGNLNMGAMSNALEVVGNLVIGEGTSGSLTLGTNFGGDLLVQGNLIRNAGASLTQNTREVVMNGSGAQSINNIAGFDYLAINNTGSGVTLNDNTQINNRLRLAAGTLNLNSNNLTMANASEIRRETTGATISAEPNVSGADQYDVRYTATMTTGNEFSSVNTSVRDLIIDGTGITPVLNANRTFNRDMNLINGNFDLATYTLTARGRVTAPAFSGSITVSGGGTRTITGSVGSQFDITGLGGNNPTDYTKTISSFGGTLLSFDSDVLVRVGDGSVDFGAGSPTTINGILQILLGGSVGQILNPCYYGVNSILRFANTVDYLVGPFDKTWAAGAISSGLPGIPYNVEVFDNGTELRLEDNRSLRGNLTITNGTFTLNYIGSGTFNIGGNWTRTGASSSFTHNDKRVIFDGLLSGSQFITVGSGVSSETFYDLEIAAASGNITLGSNTDIVVLNNLNFVSNKLDMNTTGNTITVGTATTNGSITGFDSNKYIISHDGEIIIYTNTNNVYTYPFGDASNYTPFELTLNAGAQTGAFITGKMTMETHPNIDVLNTFQFIERYWDIVPTGLTTSPIPDYDVKYSYAAIDEVGSNLTYRPVKYSYTNTNPAWIASPGGPAGFIEGSIASHNTTTREFIWEGISTFSSFTGAGDGSPLPISLINFNAEPVNKDVLVTWTTASETNNDYFQIERSKDAVNYEIVGIVDGAGNSNQILNYQLIDKKPYQGISYYRLRQTDFNGDFEVFDPVAVNFNGNLGSIINVYPNPANELTTIQINTSETDRGVLQVFSVSGALVWQTAINTVDGENSFKLDVKDLKAGQYIITVMMNKTAVKNVPLIITR